MIVSSFCSRDLTIPLKEHLVWDQRYRYEWEWSFTERSYYLCKVYLASDRLWIHCGVDLYLYWKYSLKLDIVTMINGIVLGNKRGNSVRSFVCIVLIVGFLCQKISLKSNKKVLLHERKRHTARRVASTRCAALSGGGGYPIPGLGGGYPVPGLGGYSIPGLGGVPSPRSGGYPIPGLGGYPIPGLGGTPGTPLPRPGMVYPLPGPGMGYPPYLDLGWVPPTWTWDGVPHLPRPEMGYPPPPRKLNRHTPVET